MAELVLAGAALAAVAPGAAVEAVAASAGSDLVLAGAALDPVLAAPGADQVVSASPADLVVAAQGEAGPLLGARLLAMRTLAIVHQPDAGPGVFGEAMGAAGVELDAWPIAEGGEPPSDPLGYDAVLSFGGAMNVDEEERHPWLPLEKVLLRELLERELPVIGVCLGAQLLSEAAGGTPRRASRPEIGWYEVEVTDAGVEDPVIGALAPGFEAFEWHSYECGLPADALVLARSPVCAQAYRLGERAWGIQFHAEVSAADAAHWIDEYHVDPDAVRLGIDPAVLRPETEPRIEAWNQLGRELCGRFLAVISRSGLARDVL